MKRPSKYKNIITKLDGIKFASRREARRWAALRLMEKAGEITDLQRQVRYRLDVAGHHICDYLADFTYVEALRGIKYVEDAKGVKTDAYRIKAKLMKAIHGIDIREV